MSQFDDDQQEAYDPDMETRLQKLENDVAVLKDDVTALKIDVGVIKSNYVTKADLAEAKNSIILWIISTFVLTQLLPTLLKVQGLL